MHNDRSWSTMTLHALSETGNGLLIYGKPTFRHRTVTATPACRHREPLVRKVAHRAGACSVMRHNSLCHLLATRNQRRHVPGILATQNNVSGWAGWPEPPLQNDTLPPLQQGPYKGPKRALTIRALSSSSLGTEIQSGPGVPSYPWVTSDSPGSRFSELNILLQICKSFKKPICARSQWFSRSHASRDENCLGAARFGTGTLEVCSVDCRLELGRNLLER